MNEVVQYLQYALCYKATYIHVHVCNWNMATCYWKLFTDFNFA